MMRNLVVGFLALLLGPTTALAACGPQDVRDFLALALPSGGDPVETALKLAYPGTDLDLAAAVLHLPDGGQVPYAPARDIGAAARLDGATLGDQFVYPYPLDFDLTARQTPFMDPGRTRNEAFFRALYFNDAAAARDSLVTVRHAGASFQMTTKHCVDQQLAAAFAAIAALPEPTAVYFSNIGGSFNWRVIAGTDRLSSHSFGAALDLNSDLGGYWRWAGVPEGQAGTYDNNYPAALVQAMERYGFIWGGKWHHYDGMHFEYRPELILYARLTD